VLEDSEAGIQAAHAAGIDVICVPDMKTPAAEFQQMTAAVLKSLDDVQAWLTQPAR
jgi:beta-phosphoglucomutase-like phosphatase (HAD superfamily)